MQQTRAQWKRRKRLRLARNWAILILVCAAIVALMTKGILWLLPKVNAMLAGPQSFDAASYDGTGYSFDADDLRSAGQLWNCMQRNRRRCADHDSDWLRRKTWNQASED